MILKNVFEELKTMLLFYILSFFVFLFFPFLSFFLLQGQPDNIFIQRIFNMQFASEIQIIYLPMTVNGKY